jgi:hypothetical protein
MPNQIIAKSIMTRPSVDVRWTTGDGSQVAYFKRVYLDTGKVLARTVSMSEDGLTRTTITIWPNDTERLAYMEDPFIINDLTEQTEYRIVSNIQHSWSNQEIDSNNTVIRTWSGGHFFESN